MLEEGSVGSHAAIVARALAIPLVIHAERITTEALNGDLILVDGDQGIGASAPRRKHRHRLPRQDGDAGQAQERYASIRDKPAETRCGTRGSRCT